MFVSDALCYVTESRMHNCIVLGIALSGASFVAFKCLPGVGFGHFTLHCVYLSFTFSAFSFPFSKISSNAQNDIYENAAHFP